MQAAVLRNRLNATKRLKLTFQTIYFHRINYLRSRKVPENFGNDSNKTDAICTTIQLHKYYRPTWQRGH